MAVDLGVMQLFDTSTQRFLVGGKIYTYIPTTTTNKATYPTVADALAGTNALTNPIVLDARGEARIVLTGATKLYITDSLGNEVYTIASIGDSSNDVYDSNGELLLTFSQVNDAVNYLNISNSITGNPVLIKATGGDTNVSLSLSTKAAGTLFLDAGTTGEIKLGNTSSGAITLYRATTCETTLDVVGTLEVEGTVTHNSTTVLAGVTTCNENIVFSPTTKGITGTTTNDDVVAGGVGEFATSAIVSNTIAVSGTPINLTSISLTAGDWDVWSGVYFASAPNNTSYTTSINTTSATLLSTGDAGWAGFSSSTQISLSLVSSRRVSIGSTTTVYLVGHATFSGTSPTLTGKIWARRRR